MYTRIKFSPDFFTRDLNQRFLNRRERSLENGFNCCQDGVTLDTFHLLFSTFAMLFGLILARGFMHALKWNCVEYTSDKLWRERIVRVWNLVEFETFLSLKNHYL